MRRLIILLTAIVLSTPIAFTDTIIFKDGRTLEGPNVNVIAEHAGGVDIRVEHGEITLQWPQIKNIIIDYESNLAAMQTQNRDTPRALYRFVELLMRHEMAEEAAETCAIILTRENVSEEVLLNVARLMEEQEEWDLAYKAYEKIHQQNPSRGDVIAGLDRLAPLRTEEDPEEARDPQEEPEDEPEDEPEEEAEEEPRVRRAIEYLEAEDNWEVEAWGNEADATIVEQALQDQQNKILSVEYRGRKDKTAVRLDGQWDLSEYKFVAFDIWNAGEKSFGVAIALNTFPGWKFHESHARRIAPREWVQVKIPLDTNDFKTEDTNWRHTSRLGNADNVRQLIILIYNTEAEGLVYLDNIRFIDQHGRPRRE